MSTVGPLFPAARAMLGWTVRELARRVIVSVATINAIEDTNVPSSHRQGDLAAILAVLEEGGIEFTNDDEPGVKLTAKKARRSDDPKASVCRITGPEAIDQDDGRSTSICLEDEFWQALKEIALVRELPLRQLVAVIDGQREHFNLSSSLRLFVLKFFQDETEELATWRKQAAELEKLARLGEETFLKRRSGINVGSELAHVAERHRRTGRVLGGHHSMTLVAAGASASLPSQSQ
jgi:predicted DNA-binding ribbon-helix-helix protein/DNA-binding XRE family transcriptional regulator